MRYMMMSFSVLVMLSSQDLFASAKTDSIDWSFAGDRLLLVKS